MWECTSPLSWYMNIYISSETTSYTKQSSSHKKYTFVSGQNCGSFKRWDGGEEV